MSVIYRITNMANGKFYIGSAASFERRAWQHKYDLRRKQHKNPKLQAAWNKYGEDMFVFEVLETVPEGELQLAWENRYLHGLVGNPLCYNINKDAELSRLGQRHTDAAKEKTSRSRKGKAAGEEHYRYGKKVSPEVREKIGAAQRGKPKAAGRKVTPEGRARIMAAAAEGAYSHWQGKTHTEEAKAKLRKAVIATGPDGVETRFSSLSEVLVTLGLLMPTLRRALVSGTPLRKGPRKGYSFKYVD